MTSTLSAEFLASLRDPIDHQPLTIDDKGEYLYSSTKERRWNLINGIPRFTSDEHLESFGHQWTTYQNIAHDDEDRATFQAKTGASLDELKGMRILDAGCGGGRYCKVAAEAGGNVFGADHTRAVEQAKQLCQHLPNVQLTQADLKQLPFEKESFDFAFSIGVMHHDANTKAVFDAVSQMVKPGGRYSVWLYRRNQFWQEWINRGIRHFTTKMAPEKLEPWCKWGAKLGGIPVINKTLNKIVNFSAHPDYENRVCDTYDWWAPQYQHHHTVGELKQWFTEAGFDELRVLPPEKTGLLYRTSYNMSLLIGSGVNVTGIKRST